MVSKFPLVSIACRVYNAASNIAETIESVLAQTYQNWELIITDDNSTDATREIINRYTQDKRIHYYHNEVNLGIIGNLNKVLSLCKGDYISILDGDDTYVPMKLEKQVRFLNDHSDYGACFSYINFIVDEKNLEKQKICNSLINNPAGSRVEMLRRIFKKENFLAFPTEMFRRELLINFPESIIATGDCNFHVHVLLHTQIKVLEEPLVNYRINGDANTSSWVTNNLIECENLYLVRHFAQMNDLDLFKKTFKGDYEEFDEPNDTRDIPYFIARMAMKIPHRFFNGLYLLQCIFEDNSYFRYICDKFHISYKDYISIRCLELPSTYTYRKQIKFCYFKRKQKTDCISETYLNLFNKKQYCNKIVYTVLGMKFTKYLTNK